MQTIRTFPDPCLRAVCGPVKQFNRELHKLIDSLRKTMHRQTMGIGIAAPQIGISLQVAIVDIRPRVPEAREIILINPQILNREGETLSHEGCMSLPEYTGYVERAQKIVYQALTPDGKLVQSHSEGLEAICIQHEIDHLNGKLFFDRVVTLKTDMQPRHWKKKIRRR